MKKIIINVAPWQTRVAITRDDILENLYGSAQADESLERCFFKGVVTKVLPGIQTAFVDIGQERAGFLHISEIDRELAVQRFGETMQLDDEGDADTKTQEEGAPANSRAPARESIAISSILKEGEPILVQVSKEPVYEKGAKLTTCFTLPGRFIVLMPNIPKIGISKKIESREERARLKEVLTDLLPEGMGAIIRTSSQNLTSQDLYQDVSYLIHTWNHIKTNFDRSQPTQKIYQDLDIAQQVIRDNIDDDIESIIIDDPETHGVIYKFLKGIAPEHAHKIKLYTEKSPIFEYFQIDQQLHQALEKKVRLKSGGSIIIDSVEAMTVIDVNTGRYTGKTNMEETILKTNIEAAEEIVRQLRLRNIGGLIVIDFIDMATYANRQKLYKAFEKTLKERDKFQSVVLRVSEFGLVQMTRKRSGKTLVQQMMRNCTTCHGNGFVRSTRTICYELLHKIYRDLRIKPTKSKGSITVYVAQDTFDFITESAYTTILSFEKTINAPIVIGLEEKFNPTEYRIEYAEQTT